MTFEELLNNSADQLLTMSEEELRAFCEPFFNVTRPELAAKEGMAKGGGTKKTATGKQITEEQMRKLQELGLGDVFD